MPVVNSYVRARIDANVKKRAIDALKEMDLSVSDAIRLLMLRVADERRLPFEVADGESRTGKPLRLSADAGNAEVDRLHP